MGGTAMTKQEKGPRERKQNWNWRIWSGFLLAVAAVPGYLLVLARFPITRNVPWASWLMFAAAGWLLWAGVRRAFASPEEYRGRIAGPILAVLSLGAAGLFGYATLYASRQLPVAAGAPTVGGKAPEFTLADTNGKMVALSNLLSERDASNGREKTTRGAGGFLPGILVTVLQLRVTGYRGESE
jgi:hypothetical protein